MQFNYVAYTLAQGVVKGRLEADTQAEARAKVMNQGYKPLHVRPVAAPRALEDLFPALFRVKVGELVQFSRYVATMVASGGNLLRALEMLQRESRNRVMARTLGDIRKTLDEGGSFSQALAKHPRTFNPLFVCLVEVGEYTGRLGPALEQMADILERGHEARQKIIRALMYPAAIIALALVTMSVLMLVAVPPMLKVFQSMGTDVPWVTKLSVGFFGLLRSKFLYIMFLGAFMVGAFWLLRRIPKVRYWMDVAQIRAPLLGSTVIAAELSRFSRVMSMLTEAGVPLATALHLGITGCRNQVLKQPFEEAEESLLSGHGLTSALKRHPILPVMFVELVMIGEESNTLQRSMGDAATAYQKQLESRLNGLLSILEPASTVVIGAIVGLLAFSMFLPIYSGLKGIN